MATSSERRKKDMSIFTKNKIEISFIYKTIEVVKKNSRAVKLSLMRYLIDVQPLRVRDKPKIKCIHIRK